jgi:hypothetical protein
LAYPQGIRCGDQDVVRWDSDYGQIEHQANVFSATLLMPLDDFRRQIDPQSKADLGMLSGCAERYRVSLIAAVLRWLDYTDRRAVLVVSRDGFILWARSSKAALKTGAFFRTSVGPIAIPDRSLAARQDMTVDGRTGIELPAGVWFNEDLREMTVFADQYDFALATRQRHDAALAGRRSRRTRHIRPVHNNPLDGISHLHGGLSALWSYHLGSARRLRCRQTPGHRLRWLPVFASFTEMPWRPVGSRRRHQARQGGFALSSIRVPT